MDIKISAEDAGRTVLSFLKAKLKISSSALSSLKRIDMGIAVNGVHVTVRYILNEGDILSIYEKDTFDNVNESIDPVFIPIDIIFENEDLFIIDKPPFMPTHPSHNHTNDTLANAIAYIYKERDEPLVFRPIGRLDKNTSGISVIAKHAISASFLYYARSHSLIQKKYVALLEGCISCDNAWHTTKTFMKRMQESVIIRCVGNADDPEAFEAITHWRVLFQNSNVSLVEAVPQTGRTHQLRVHFSHLGHPIIGDDIYGYPSELIARHALHAYSLALPLPYIEEIISFTSMPPIDMQDTFRELSGMDLCTYIN